MNFRPVDNLIFRQSEKKIFTNEAILFVVNTLYIFHDQCCCVGPGYTHYLPLLFIIDRIVSVFVYIGLFMNCWFFFYIRDWNPKYTVTTCVLANSTYFKICSVDVSVKSKSINVQMNAYTLCNIGHHPVPGMRKTMIRTSLLDIRLRCTCRSVTARYKRTTINIRTNTFFSVFTIRDLTRVVSMYGKFFHSIVLKEKLIRICAKSWFKLKLLMFSLVKHVIVFIELPPHSLKRKPGCINTPPVPV